MNNVAPLNLENCNCKYNVYLFVPANTYIKIICNICMSFMPFVTIKYLFAKPKQHVSNTIWPNRCFALIPSRLI